MSSSLAAVEEKLPRAHCYRCDKPELACLCSRIPLVENVPLARGLFKSAQVGDEIPIELYQAVAEVLAYVYSLKARRRRAS